MKEQNRYPHPECRWKGVSCVKYLLTKKAYDQKRLEKAIRHSKTSSSFCGSHSSNGGSGSSRSSGTGHGAGDDEDVEVMDVERTELELATEATVVRAKGAGRQARKELRHSMTRYASHSSPPYHSLVQQRITLYIVARTREGSFNTTQSKIMKHRA